MINQTKIFMKYLSMRQGKCRQGRKLLLILSKRKDRVIKIKLKQNIVESNKDKMLRKLGISPKKEIKMEMMEIIMMEEMITITTTMEEMVIQVKILILTIVVIQQIAVITLVKFQKINRL